jgi:hypothetical protein
MVLHVNPATARQAWCSAKPRCGLRLWGKFTAPARVRFSQGAVIRLLAIGLSPPKNQKMGKPEPQADDDAKKVMEAKRAVVSAILLVPVTFMLWLLGKWNDMTAITRIRGPTDRVE